MIPEPFPGMIEMFTTPTYREREANIVKRILRRNKIRYRSREEIRNDGTQWRYCIYVPKEDSDRAYTAIDEGLLEEGL